jgi:16S rRNA (guanine527-N7)-methyltransferase
MTNLPQNWLEYLKNNFGVELDGKQAGAFRFFYAELAEWNQKFNLVSYKTPDEVFWRHFADSLAAVPAIDAYAALAASRVSSAEITAVDIGAGAGFPGLPVKIARPGIKMIFAESITKKTSFISNIIGKLQLAGADVFNGRAELLGQDKNTREKYDVTLSRAVSALSPNLEAALPLLKTGGIALVHKSDAYEAELAASKNALETLGGSFEKSFNYTLPGYDRGHCVLIFRKTSASPQKYPRRPGMSEKKPL